jgi:hypothetical protein
VKDVRSARKFYEETLGLTYQATVMIWPVGNDLDDVEKELMNW